MTQSDYDGPVCEFCSVESAPIFLMPTFTFADFKNEIVNGEGAVVVDSMRPAWACSGCGKLKVVTLEEADHWRAFWFDMILQLSNVMTKTQFLESAPFGKKKNNV